jgi:hypothetical protein
VYRFWQHYQPFLPAAFLVDPIFFIRIMGAGGAFTVRSPIDVLPESMRSDAVGE